MKARYWCKGNTYHFTKTKQCSDASIYIYPMISHSIKTKMKQVKWHQHDVFQITRNSDHFTKTKQCRDASIYIQQLRQLQ